ncbi:hypothetical protein HK099_005418 [Clydaea vesicula]|uniref:Uncharacterized protein n=1 Tax=Clydaea vesicula TaxID=447962 RepID=A0AAD5U6H6_9FUNG|nr:hypothetical protein HK099_005418 [Clydaea vesicula]
MTVVLNNLNKPKKINQLKENIEYFRDQVAASFETLKITGMITTILQAELKTQQEEEDNSRSLKNDDKNNMNYRNLLVKRGSKDENADGAGDFRSLISMINSHQNLSQIEEYNKKQGSQFFLRSTEGLTNKESRLALSKRRFFGAEFLKNEGEEVTLKISGSPRLPISTLDTSFNTKFDNNQKTRKNLVSITVEIPADTPIKEHCHFADSSNSKCNFSQNERQNPFMENSFLLASQHIGTNMASLTGSQSHLISSLIEASSNNEESVSKLSDAPFQKVCVIDTQQNCDSSPDLKFRLKEGPTGEPGVINSANKFISEALRVDFCNQKYFSDREDKAHQEHNFTEIPVSFFVPSNNMPLTKFLNEEVVESHDKKINISGFLAELQCSGENSSTPQTTVIDQLLHSEKDTYEKNEIPKIPSINTISESKEKTQLNNRVKDGFGNNTSYSENLEEASPAAMHNQDTKSDHVSNNLDEEGDVMNVEEEKKFQDSEKAYQNWLMEQQNSQTAASSEYHQSVQQKFDEHNIIIARNNNSLVLSNTIIKGGNKHNGSERNSIMDIEEQKNKKKLKMSKKEKKNKIKLQKEKILQNLSLISKNDTEINILVSSGMIPKNLKINLITETLPILDKTLKNYKDELGEKNLFLTKIEKKIKYLLIQSKSFETAEFIENNDFKFGGGFKPNIGSLWALYNSTTGNKKGIVKSSVLDIGESDFKDKIDDNTLLRLEEGRIGSCD